MRRGRAAKNVRREFVQIFPKAAINVQRISVSPVGDQIWMIDVGQEIAGAAVLWNSCGFWRVARFRLIWTTKVCG
jgi:hypothetical protein